MDFGKQNPSRTELWLCFCLIIIKFGAVEMPLLWFQPPHALVLARFLSLFDLSVRGQQGFGVLVSTRITVGIAAREHEDGERQAHEI